MTVSYVPEHLEAFLYVLDKVGREVILRQKTRARLFQSAAIDAAWVEALKTDDERSDIVESFVSRFARLQDNIGDKLLPKLAALEAEPPTSAIDRYNNAERRGFIRSAADWLTMRALRNRLVHEYLDQADEFAEALNLADRFANDLIDAYEKIKDHATGVIGTELLTAGKPQSK